MSQNNIKIAATQDGINIYGLTNIQYAYIRHIIQQHVFKTLDEQKEGDPPNCPDVLKKEILRAANEFLRAQPAAGVN